MSTQEESGQTTTLTARPSSSRSFRRAFGFGAVGWLVVSSLAVAHNHTRRPGIIFGELLGTSLIAGCCRGKCGASGPDSPYVAVSYRGFPVRVVRLEIFDCCDAAAAELDRHTGGDGRQSQFLPGGEEWQGNLPARSAIRPRSLEVDVQVFIRNCFRSGAARSSGVYED